MKGSERKSNAIVEMRNLVGESGSGSAGHIADEEHDLGRLPLTDSGVVGRGKRGKLSVGGSCWIENERTGSGSSARTGAGSETSELGVGEFGSRDSSTVEASNRSRNERTSEKVSIRQGEENVHSVREVAIRSRREGVVDHRSTESSSIVDRSPDHYSERNTRLDESVVGDELVVGDDGTDKRVGERTHVDHVDSSHRVSSFGDDRVGVDERSRGTEDDDGSIGGIDDGVSSDGGVLASERDSVGLNKGNKSQIELERSERMRGRTHWLAV